MYNFWFGQIGPNLGFSLSGSSRLYCLFSRLAAHFYESRMPLHVFSSLAFRLATPFYPGAIFNFHIRSFIYCTIIRRFFLLFTYFIPPFLEARKFSDIFILLKSERTSYHLRGSNPLLNP